MFWDIYADLCKSSGKTPGGAALEMGFSNATCTRWKQGAVPGGRSLQKIADYFGVSVSQLMGGEAPQEPPPPEQTPDDPVIEDVMVYARAMMQTDSGRKKLADIARFMRQSVELEDLGRKIFNG